MKIQVGEQTHENQVCMHIIGLVQTPLILSISSLLFLGTFIYFFYYSLMSSSFFPFSVFLHTIVL